MKRYFLSLLLILMAGACGLKDDIEPSPGFAKITPRKLEKPKSAVEFDNSFQNKCEGPLVLTMIPSESVEVGQPIKNFTAISNHSYALPKESLFLSTRARCREIKDGMAGSFWQYQRWHEPDTTLKLVLDLTNHNKASILDGEYIETTSVRAYLSYPIYKSQAFSSLTLRCPGKFRVGCREFTYGINGRQCKNFDIVPENQVCKLSDDIIPFSFSDNSRLDLKIEGQVNLDPNHTQIHISKIGWDEV